MITKILIAISFGILFFCAYQIDLNYYLTLDFLQGNLSHLRILVDGSPADAMFIYFLFFILLAAISLPGVTILTLLAGALFGVVNGLIIVSFASTIGATLAFWGSRFLFQDFISAKFSDQLHDINQSVEKNGIFYLLSLRLIPFFPFFLVNALMGVTRMKTIHFFIVSQIGMFPITLLFVLAGQRFSRIHSISEVLNPQTIVILILFGVLPYLIKFVNNRIKYKAQR